MVLCCKAWLSLSIIGGNATLNTGYFNVPVTLCLGAKLALIFVTFILLIVYNNSYLMVVIVFKVGL